jgi:hypothetical protein
MRMAAQITTAAGMTTSSPASFAGSRTSTTSRDSRIQEALDIEDEARIGTVTFGLRATVKGLLG